MIRVTVELLPFGDPTHPEHLGTALIANDIRDSLESGGRLGSYQVVLSKRGHPIESISGAPASRIWKRGQVRGFDRIKRGPWDLLYLALDSIVASRNKPKDV